MKFADGNGYFDIIIYIIIMVVGLLANAYRNSAKRKEQQNRQPGEVIPDFPEVEFEPVFEYEEPVYREPPRREPEPEPEAMLETGQELTSSFDTEPTMEETVSLEEVTALGIPEIEGQAVFQSTKEGLVSDHMSELGITLAEGESTGLEISENEIGREEEVTVLERFDLERAVINAEILRTKYFRNSY
jgi:hypothetical protein